MARPNFLIFMTDQQRADSTFPEYPTQTPVLDRFRKQAVQFRRSYCPSPHCCPSRASFFSGLYPSQHGVWHNVQVGNAITRGLAEDVRLWSEDLAGAGYEMKFAGKWHVSAHEGPQARGWQSDLVTAPPLSEADAVAGERRRYKEMQTLASPEQRGEGEILRPGYGTYRHYGVKERPHGDADVVEEAIRQLSATSSDGPWCQFVGTLGPHDPYFAPQRFLDLYSLNDIELPPSFADQMADKPALYRRTRDRFDQLSEREHREALRHYYAFCSYEDFLFGEVLAALDARGDADNTVVIYLSDHGDYAGEHGLWCKGLPCFDGAYRVPCLVRWPAGIANPGRDVDAFVSLTDFAPTILDLAGVSTERPFAGDSLRPFLEDRPPSGWRDAHFTQSNGNELYGIQRSVTTDEWKYVFNGFDYDELYHLPSDPLEQHNLAQTAGHDDVVRALCTRLWEFAFAHDDRCTNPYIMVALAPYGPGVALAQRTN